MDLGQFGQIGALATGVAFLTQMLVAGLTLWQPQRPAWVAWVASLIVGILMCFLMAAAAGVFHGLDVPPLDQLLAQIIIVGMVGGAGAGTANQLATKAEAKRLAAQGPTLGEVGQ